MADKAGWHRFTQVTQSVPSGHKLYRASAPNYKKQDSDQDLTQEAVDFLVSQGIDSIISFNEYEYRPVEREKLAKATQPIRYLHLKLGDFKPPTLAQFRQANDFFLENKSTLVHCGYGWGRSGTGVTGLQIYTENGKNFQPLASSWSMPLAYGGNNVEKREQVSILSELRNLFLSRVTGIPTSASDPKQAFAVINFATGYYLTVSNDKHSVVSLSPEMVETAPSIEQAYQWTISRDNQGNYTLSNKTTPVGFALTRSQDAEVDDSVTYGTQSQGNIQFSIKEAETGAKGRYLISPVPNPALAVAIKAPSNYIRLTQLMPVLLASSDEDNKFGLWVLLTADFE